MDNPEPADELERVFRELVRERDKLLRDELVISSARRRALRQLLAPASPLGFKAWSLPAHAAFAATCLFFAVWFLHIGGKENRSREVVPRIAVAPLPDAPAARAQFNLRVSPMELASLRSSFLALDRSALAASTEDPLRIRLDLSIRYEPKRTLALLISGLSIFSAKEIAAETKIGTVDFNLVFKQYGKTKEAEAQMNDAKNAAKNELDERVDAYKKAMEEINKLNAQIGEAALSAEAKASKAKERDEKIANVKKMEGEINQLGQTREQQLQQQVARKREEILREITEVVLQRVKASNVDLVFDKSGASLNGFSALLFSRESHDFTAEVNAALEKRKP